MNNHIDKNEVGISLLKIGLSNIPYVGQLLSEALFEYRGRIKQNRLNKFTELLSDYFGNNSEINIEKIQSEDFSDLFEAILKRVAETKSEQKLRHFRDILTNSLNENLDYENSEIYLDLISNLSEIDMSILKNHQLFDNKFDKRYDTKNLYEKLLPELEKNVQNEYELREKGFANDWDNAVIKYNATKNAIRAISEQNKSVNIYRTAEFYGINDAEFLYSKQKLYSLGLLIDSGFGKFDYKPFGMMSITEFAKKFLEFIKNS
ncbi:hypothetical protein [Chryseobacterium gambrini]|uniref:hypothetical protein n=1 Tax=Chryseobacterium gambrini TaxID=373672 RepID=UPI0022F1C5F1|nr:hypothetical protein [Chryseobacterium gambrini]WBV52053.1 hypothetical protein PFY09_17200 [Chryseobacterium gambrini]